RDPPAPGRPQGEPRVLIPVEEAPFDPFQRDGPLPLGQGAHLQGPLELALEEAVDGHPFQTGRGGPFVGRRRWPGPAPAAQPRRQRHPQAQNQQDGEPWKGSAAGWSQGHQEVTSWTTARMFGSWKRLDASASHPSWRGVVGKALRWYSSQMALFTTSKRRPTVRRSEVWVGLGWPRRAAEVVSSSSRAKATSPWPAQRSPEGSARMASYRVQVWSGTSYWPAAPAVTCSPR